jgi:hypothetical protein
MSSYMMDPQQEAPAGWCPQCGREIWAEGEELCTRCREEEQEKENTALVPILECRQPPVIRENLLDLGNHLQRVCQEVAALPKTRENMACVKKTRAELRKYFEMLEQQRKQVKKEVMAPYTKAEELYKRLVSEPMQAADKLCKTFVEDVEGAVKKACEDNLREYFTELCQMKGIYWLPFEKLGIKVDMAMANQKEPKKAMETIRNFVDGVDQTLTAINGMENSSAILEAYTKTLDLAKAVAIVQERKESQRVAEENREKWQQVRESRSQNAAQICAAVPEIGVVSRVEPAEKEYRLVFAATATRPMLRALVEFANAHNIKIQVVTENG